MVVVIGRFITHVSSISRLSRDHSVASHMDNTITVAVNVLLKHIHCESN